MVEYINLDDNSGKPQEMYECVNLFFNNLNDELDLLNKEEELLNKMKILDKNQVTFKKKTLLKK